MALLPLVCASLSFAAVNPFDRAHWVEQQHANQQILSLPPDASRNFQISLAYHNIGRPFSALLRANSTMNWATMAKWASNIVGMGIRKKFLPHWIDELLAKWPAWIRKAVEKDADLLDRLFDQLLNVTSIALSGGNKAVFIEIGGAFSAFGVAVANMTKPDGGERMPGGKRHEAVLGRLTWGTLHLHMYM